jgi:hypothetical protein
LHKGFNERSIAPAGWIYPGVWEIPVYTTSVDITGHPPVTGFDSSILTQAYGNQFDVMLRMGLDYRLTALGNRAPYTVGLHSDTYSGENASAKIHYDPRMDLPTRKKALSDFIDYALTRLATRIAFSVSTFFSLPTSPWKRCAPGLPSSPRAQRFWSSIRGAL